jgi:hypothetical protein
MNRTAKIMSLLMTLLFNVYSILPTYCVQIAGDGTAHIFPHDAKYSTLANRTFRLPGIEEMNGDFHHHDAQGNDLIRVEKKDGVIREGIVIQPATVVDILPLLLSAGADCLIAYTRSSQWDKATKHELQDDFISGRTGHSPPLLS